MGWLWVIYTGSNLPIVQFAYTFVMIGTMHMINRLILDGITFETFETFG